MKKRIANRRSRIEAAETFSLKQYLEADGEYNEHHYYGHQRVIVKRIRDYGALVRLELDFNRNMITIPAFGGMQYIACFDKVRGVIERSKKQTALRRGILYSNAGIGEGSFVIFPGRTPIRCYVLLLDPDAYLEMLGRRFKNIELDPASLFNSLHSRREPPELEAIFDQMMRYRYAGQAKDLFYECKFNEVMSWLISSADVSEPAAPRVSDSDRIAIYRTADILTAEISRDPSVEELAKAALCSVSKFSRCFKQVMGCTVTEYKENVRLSKAKQLLSETDETITAIAMSVGYKKLNNFNSFFFKHTKMTPRDYRQAFTNI